MKQQSVEELRLSGERLHSSEDARQLLQKESERDHHEKRRLAEELEERTEEVTALSQLLFELREKVKELEVGTATSLRSERERKDKEIAELRRELDEVC